MGSTRNAAKAHYYAGAPLESSKIIVKKTSGVTVRVITTDEEFDLLQESWEKLFEQSSSATIFQSYTWLRTWWTHRGARHDNQLHVVAIEQDGALICVAPFFIHTRRVIPFVSNKELAFLGRQDSDYLDILVRDGSRDAAYSELADHLEAQSHLWDVVALEDFHSAPLCLAEHLQRSEWTTDVTVIEECPRIELTGTWDDYLATLTKEIRRDIKRRLRNLHASHEVEYEVLRSPEEVREGLPDMIRLHQHRRNAVGDAGLFACPSFRSFQNEVMPQLAQAGHILLTFLKINGRRVASSLCFQFRNTLSPYLLGLGDAGTAMMYSPGKVLHCYNMQYAIAAGVSVYDFMRGTEPFKYEFGGAARQNWLLTAIPHTGTAGIVVSIKRNSALVLESAHRRMEKEYQLARTTSRRHGSVSIPMVRYLNSRFSVLLTHGRRKIKNPDKPVYIS